MLSRLALRLAAMEALAPSSLLETGGGMTLVGRHVYDSRQMLIDGLDETLENQPVICVYTEEVEGLPYMGNKIALELFSVSLVVEMTIVSKSTIGVQDAEHNFATIGEINVPLMESVHEGILDVLEAQVMRRLVLKADCDDAKQLFHSIAIEVVALQSYPLRDNARSARLAGRTLSIKCRILPDDWPEASLTPVVREGFDLLPNPLQKVARFLPEQSSGYQLCKEIVPLIQGQGTLTGLAEASAFVGLNRVATANNNDAAVHIVFPTQS